MWWIFWQIDEIESVMTCDNSIVTTANIGAMLNRMQQIFVALASKLHSLHEDIKIQKDFYLNYRKVNLFDFLGVQFSPYNYQQ